MSVTQTYIDLLLPSLIESNYGTECLVDMFKDADANLTVYKNNVTWCFIEMIAFEVTDGIEIYHEDYAIANAY